MADTAPGQLTRQQLYDRIRETSKDEVILAEMKRLGFWQNDGGKPNLPEELITRRGELQRELQGLMKTQRTLADPEKALKEFRKSRLAEARLKREQTKIRKSHDRHERALKWHNRQDNEITSLGQDVSYGLKNKQPDMARLRAQGLPVLHNAKALATAMGITLNELRFLSFSRKTAKVSHYKRFLIAKKTGGERLISAPMPRLKRVQYWLLDNILMKPGISDQAHGFVPGKSIVSNASAHLGKDVVINLDLKDFFPSVDYKRIKGLFCKLGYSEEIATIFALVCSEPERDEMELDGQSWFLAKGKRFMPQGAPTSPALSNLICRRLDKRLQGLAQKFGYAYSRYADDLTFSASGDAAKMAGRLVKMIDAVVTAEGFAVHPGKTRIMRKGRRQEVTGLTVNEKLSVDRAELKKFRALLFQIEKDGPEGKSWGAGNLFAAITGFANYVAMVSPEKGAPLKARVAAIIAKYSSSKSQHAERKPLHKEHFRKAAATGQHPRSDWWQAMAKEAPVYVKTDYEVKQEKLEKKRAEREAQKAEQARNNPSHSVRQGQRSEESVHDRVRSGFGRFEEAVSALNQQTSTEGDQRSQPSPSHYDPVMEKEERFSMILLAIVAIAILVAIVLIVMK